MSMSSSKTRTPLPITAETQVQNLPRSPKGTPPCREALREVLDKLLEIVDRIPAKDDRDHILMTAVTLQRVVRERNLAQAECVQWEKAYHELSELKIGTRNG